MSEQNKDQQAILNKLGIEALNPMQLETHQAISNNSEVVLLSPTGTGKTLAFALPLIADLGQNIDSIQAVIVVPSRELAIQIEQVIRNMGSGFKTNAVYGGRSGSKDKIELKHAPAILIGTPGRVADHLRRGTIDSDQIKMLVLDEFDKSLEIGFKEDMKDIIYFLPALQKKVLTSATQKVEIPRFIDLKNPTELNFLKNKKLQLKLNTVESREDEKLETLVQLLGHIGKKRGIIFCNFKDSIQDVSDFLCDNNIGHSSFFGGLEQIDRERALIKFRNGSHQILLATDLAARGIDVPELDYIIHYELPMRKDEFIHRNGRTARMNTDGTAYILKTEREELPIFIKGSEIINIKNSSIPENSKWSTIYISGGRKDKISKGDIAGLFFKQGNLNRDELGIIELKHDCAFVAVPTSKTKGLVNQLNNSRLKKKKVRISVLD